MHSLSLNWKRSISSTRKIRPVATSSRTHIGPTSRRASTSANPYPFPNTARPTPHQVFHLPKSATRAEVKARCQLMSLPSTPLANAPVRLRPRSHLPSRLPFRSRWWRLSRDSSCTLSSHIFCVRNSHWEETPVLGVRRRCRRWLRQGSACELP